MTTSTITQTNTQKIRITFLMRSAQGGGAERVTIALANQLAAKGYHIDFIFIQAVGPFLQDIDHRIHVIDLGVRRTLLAPVKLYQQLKRHRPDVLISALNYINIMAIMACRCLKGKRPKTMITEHGTLSAVLESLRGTGKLVPMLMQRCYPFADRIIAVSHGVADDLAQQLQLSPQQIQTIYNPMDFDKIFSKKNIPLNHPWVNCGIPLILGAGRLVEVKNFPLLIAAFERVRAQQACRLVIIGEGEKRTELETQIQSSAYAQDIALLGFSDNPYQWMAAANLFVLSSRTEGLPTVLIEALLCGTQVISTDCPYGPREILQDGQFGSLVPVDDVAALAAEMLKKLQHTSAPQIDLTTLAQRFGQDSITLQYEQEIQQLCSGATA
ncbi:glycosyltransferase [Acinetobacter qingfengensis]|uniref:Glycosyltransferase subfamily 4-like N-terminal domain-containing protein n=1 Tax=Acinetobacter qingfengensis TaxID=1262585 RepID=A0A1E7RCZ7_9GAMM|nr:glycosyltransferase [Acinetobacter qingfengensis]OEY97280.1 hypothetical protein BJI46_01635 [Acinetobacter qingfengensis]